MQRFVTALLTEDGALVEPLGTNRQDMLAPQQQQALGVGEFCRFGFGFGTTLPEGPAGGNRNRLARLASREW